MINDNELLVLFTITTNRASLFNFVTIGEGSPWRDLLPSRLWLYQSLKKFVHPQKCVVKAQFFDQFNDFIGMLEAQALYIYKYIGQTNQSILIEFWRESLSLLTKEVHLRRVSGTGCLN